MPFPAQVLNSFRPWRRRLTRRAASLVLLVAVTLAALAPSKIRAKRVAAAPDVLTVPQVLRGEIRLPFVPEYDRAMDRVLLAVERNGLAEDMAAKAGILRTLPAYTEVLLLSDAPLGRGVFGRRSEEDSLRGRIIREGRVRWFDPESATAWAQDVGEGVGNVMFVGVKGREHGDALQRLGVRAIRHVLPLDGGNVSLARNERGERIVFVGDRELENARSAFMREGFAASDARLLDAYRLSFGADKTVVLPTAPPDHIDQNVLFVGDGRAVTESVPALSVRDQELLDGFLEILDRTSTDGPMEYVDAFDDSYAGDTREVRSESIARVHIERASIPRLLLPVAVARAFTDFRQRVPHLQDLLYTHEFNTLREETERRLVENGFTVTRLETTISARLNKQYYVNAMVYRDRDTGEPSLLLPAYPAAGRSEEGVDLQRLAGTNARNVAKLAALGFRVKSIPGQYLRGGSTHCSLYQF